jgi:hypothetical protein
MIGIWPPIVSAIAGPSPLYGMIHPYAEPRARSSPAMCGEEPAARAEREALAAAFRECNEFRERFRENDGCTIIRSGVEPTSVTGAKSLTESPALCRRARARPRCWSAA